MVLIFHAWVYFISSFLQNQVSKPSTNSEQVTSPKPRFFLGHGEIPNHHFDIIISSLGLNQQIVTTSKYWADHKVTSLLGSFWEPGLSVPCGVHKATSHRAFSAPTPPLSLPNPGFPQCGQGKPSFLHHDTRMCCLADASGYLSVQVLFALT